MDLLEICLIGFAPGLFWLWFLYRKDVLEPEPAALVMLVFVLGCGSALAALLARPALDGMLPIEPDWLRHLLDAYVVTAGGEELIKFAAFFLGAFWHRELDEPMDGIVYGAAAGLGFASVENVLYVLWAGDLGLLFARSFTATLAHIACSGALGFAAGLALLQLRTHGAAARVSAAGKLVLGAIAAIALHGTYDIFLFAYPTLWWASLLVTLPLMLALLAAKLRWSHARSPDYHPDGAV